MRTEARIKCSVWTDPAFLDLPDRAKLLYLFLLTQDDLALCGVIPIRVTRWATRLQWKPQHIEEYLGILETARFVVSDPAMGELLIRTLMRHDGILSNPKVREGARRACGGVSSLPIRAALAIEYPEVAEEWGIDGLSDSLFRKTIEDEGIGDRRQEIGERRDVATSRAQEAEGVSNVRPLRPPPQDELVYSAWREAGKLNGRTSFTKERRAKVRGRLTEYPVEDVVDAAKGIWLDVWHVGHQRTDLIYAMRDVERFRDLKRGLITDGGADKPRLDDRPVVRPPELSEAERAYAASLRGGEFQRIGASNG